MPETPGPRNHPEIDPATTEDHKQQPAGTRTGLAVATEPGFPAAGAVPPFSGLHSVFFGSEGLRAFWSILLFVAIRLALVWCVWPLLHMLLAIEPRTPGILRPRFTLASEGAAFVCVAVATWVMAMIERRPTAAYGLGGKRRVRNFLAGLAWGVALLSLLVFALRATGLLAFDARLLSGRSALGYAAVWFVGFLLVGLYEEYFARGFVQFTLSRGFRGIYGWLGASHADALGFWTAAFLTSFYFGFRHHINPGESPVGLFSAGLIAMVFCLSLWRTGSLWWAIGFHAAWDWAQSFLYGVADSGAMFQGHWLSTHPIGRPIFSGGTTGPEGSLFVLPVIGLAIAVVLITLPRTHAGHVSVVASQE